MQIPIYYQYILIIIAIDIFGLNQKWGENFTRRTLHHVMRKKYDPSRIPNIYPIALREQDIGIINKLVLSLNNRSTCGEQNSNLTSLVGGLYSKKCIILRNDMQKSYYNKLYNIGRSYEQSFSSILGKQVFLTSGVDNIFINQYDGENSGFMWHYDNEDKSCYRAVFLLRKENTNARFVYKDINGKNVYINQNIGDGVLLRGTTTFHSAEKLINNDSKRTIISFQYTSNLNYIHKSFCSELSSATLFEIIKNILPNIMVYIICLLVVIFLFKPILITHVQLCILFIIGILGIIVISLYKFKHMYQIIKLGNLFLSLILILLPIFIICPIETLIYILYICFTEKI